MSLPLGRSLGLATAVVLLFHASGGEAQDLSRLGVGLRGRYAADSLGRTELLAMVEVGASLDAPLGEPAGASSPEQDEARRARGEGSDDEATALTEPSLADPLDAEPPPLRRSGKRRDPSQVTLELERCSVGLVPAFVTKLVTVAGRAQGLDQSLERLESQSSRSHTSAWLPELRLRAGRDVDQSLRLTPTTDDPYRYTQSGGISYVYEATVGWRLGRLVFSSEELGIERLRMGHARERERLRETLLPLIFAWQEALCLSLVRPQSRLFARRLLELEIELDQLSGGWFSVHKTGASAPLASPIPPAAASPLPPRPRAAEHSGPVLREAIAGSFEGSVPGLAAPGVSR